MKRTVQLGVTALLLALVVRCGRDSEQLHCDDLLPVEQTSYSALARIITDVNDTRNCASCHYGSAPVSGLNLETPASSYFTLRDRIDRIYAQIASHNMPPEEGDPWSDDDLRLLRSWYCRGAYYE